MVSRTMLFLVTGFWLTMNILLWRAEFRPSQANATRIPASLVWQKILTAPDTSSLSLHLRGKTIGFCHWETGSVDQWAKVSEDTLPAQTKPRGYTLRIDGSAILPQWTNRLRFDVDLKLSARREWQEINLRASVRPSALELHANAAEETLRWRTDDDGEVQERSVKFSQLRNPASWIGDIAGPLAGMMVQSIGIPMPQASTPHPVPDWEAWDDTLMIRHCQARVYRLETRLLGRFPVTLLVSRIGEILRLELPGGLVLMNDQLNPD